MKITRNTPEELIVRSSLPLAIIWPLVSCGVFVGAGALALAQGNIIEGVAALTIAGFPGYFVWREARMDIARLNRSEDVLEIRCLSLFRADRVRHPLGDLSHALVDQLVWGKERRSRVLLYLDRGMDKGQHPLISHHSLTRQTDRAAEAINSWLKASAGHGTEDE